MTSIQQCKETSIIIAEPDQHQLQEIQFTLSENGFTNLHTATDGAELRALLKQFQQNFDNVGLLILSHALPDCPVAELCRSLASEDSDFRIPVIVLTDPETEDESLLTQLQPLLGSGVAVVEKPLRAQSFLPLLQIALVLKHERSQNRIQQERTLTELAE
ncbi:MAG TPA: response regulator transcription factor, partial [Methylothermaceae bacterium]|nr:response regulator transcription factor [Methylothermaceae bacterium]